MKRRRIGRGGHSHPTGTIADSTSLDSVACTFNVDTNTTISTLELPPTNTTVLVPSQGNLTPLTYSFHNHLGLEILNPHCSQLAASHRCSNFCF
uniref:Uncharacterized protein n=1 Tax=Picea sitchensis TaxID=3332 RepID=A9NP99_PICSI|nr:unknown [Picea sitchensis]ACN40552.1 unknown [Picea sitchensis]